MYGLTCSLREGCTYLQQIPSGRMLQALTFLTMRGARTGIECWCCDARVITPCRLRVRPRRNFWPPGTHHLTIRCSRTSQIRNASQASCSIAAPPSSAGTSSASALLQALSFIGSSAGHDLQPSSPSFGEGFSPFWRRRKTRFTRLIRSEIGLPKGNNEVFPVGNRAAIRTPPVHMIRKGQAAAPQIPSGKSDPRDHGSQRRQGGNG